MKFVNIKGNAVKRVDSKILLTILSVYVFTLYSSELFAENSGIYVTKPSVLADGSKFPIDIRMPERVKLNTDAKEAKSGSSREIKLLNDIYTSNDQIFYVGSLSSSRNKRLFRAYDRAKTKPTILSISSNGGYVSVGLELGEWVLDKQLDVHIPRYCLSSCANYVFTAGRRIYLGANAVIHWHGSPAYDDLVENTLDEKERVEKVLKGLKDRDIGDSEPYEFWRKVRERNRRFFRRAGVSPLVTMPYLLASASVQLELDRKFPSYVGFGAYVSLQDLKIFGRENILVENMETWNPSASPYFHDGVVLITMDDKHPSEMKRLHRKIYGSEF